MSEETKNDEQTPETISTPSSPPAATATITEMATQETESQFDAAAFELDYGLPQGTLGEAKDEAAAMEALRGYTDKLLAAGVNFNSTAKPQTPATPAQADDKKPATPASGEKAEEAPAWAKPIIERLDKIEQQSQLAQQTQFQTQMAELDGRIVDEIDSWKSERYGTSESRGYKQTQAMNEIGQLLRTQAAGYLAQGKTPPRIETLLRQVRAFHDPDYTPGKKATPTEAKPLGTPGASGARPTSEEPRSIHHAFAARSW